jgi:hypothetical protein
MIDLRRLRPYLCIGIVLALTMVLVDVTLQWLGSTSVLGWLPSILAGSGFLEDSRQRVALATQEYEKGLVDRDHYLCVIIGLSNVREGINLDVISNEANVNCRYLGLAGAGGGMLDVAKYADVVLTSSLRPDLVVIGIGPYQVADPKPLPSALKHEVPQMLRRLDLRHAAIAVRNGSFINSRRQDISLALEDATLDARARLFRNLHVQLKEPEGGTRSPWRAMMRAMGKEHYSEATLREELHSTEAQGYFDLATYTRSTKPPAALVRMIKQFRERDATVVVVLLPEHPWLRRRMPENITRFVRDPIRQAFPEETPPVVDLRDAITEDGFVDLGHLNTNGGNECSRLLAAQLRHHFPRHPPLMKAQVQQQSSAP